MMRCNSCSKKCICQEAAFCMHCGQPQTTRQDDGTTAVPLSPLNEAILSRQRDDDMYFVLLGESGIGKSSWINSFVNHLKHASFESACHGPVYAPIYSQFNHADKNSKADEISDRVVRIAVGEPENICQGYASGNVSASATAMPMCYKVKPEDGSFCINLIDTPGVKSSCGSNTGNNWGTVEKTDNENVDAILNYISQYEYINAFIILLKPGEEKLQPAFAYTLRMLIQQLHKSAKDNVVFAFTHSNYCTFDDTATILVLNSFLEDMDIQIKSSNNVLYFDSTPFRYLATKSRNYMPKENPFVVNECWDESVQSCKKLIMYVDMLTPHKTYATVSIFDAKCMIFLLLKPLLKLCKLIEENIGEVKKAIEDLANHQGRSLMKSITEKSLIYKTLDKPMTVCTNSACCEQEGIFEDGLRIKKNRYSQICCKNCRVPFISNESPGQFFLHFCSTLMLGGKCKKCNHAQNEHMHVTYELLEAEKEFNIETRYIKKRKEELESELATIIDTLAFFSKYLSKNALMSDEGNPVYAYFTEEGKKASESYGVAVQEKGRLEEEIKVNGYVTEKGQLETLIRDKEIKYQRITECKSIVSELERFRETHQPDVDTLLLKEMETKLKTGMKTESVETEEDYMGLMDNRETSIGEDLDKLKKEHETVVELDRVNQTCNDTLMLLEGLRKITEMYHAKLIEADNEGGNISAIEVTQRINSLCELKHNGEQFENIYSKILVLRNKHSKENTKLLDLNEENSIPNYEINNTKKPVEG